MRLHRRVAVRTHILQETSFTAHGLAAQGDRKPVFLQAQGLTHLKGRQQNPLAGSLGPFLGPGLRSTAKLPGVVLINVVIAVLLEKMVDDEKPHHGGEPVPEAGSATRAQGSWARRPNKLGIPESMLCRILYYTILLLYYYYTITILYHIILYYTILYYTILYYTILYYTILYYTILYYTILYYTILYYTIVYYTIIYYTLLYYTMQYYTIL